MTVGRFGCTRSTIASSCGVLKRLNILGVAGDPVDFARPERCVQNVAKLIGGNYKPPASLTPRGRQQPRMVPPRTLTCSRFSILAGAAFCTITGHVTVSQKTLDLNPGGRSISVFNLIGVLIVNRDPIRPNSDEIGPSCRSPPPAGFGVEKARQDRLTLQPPANIVKGDIALSDPRDFALQSPTGRSLPTRQLFPGCPAAGTVMR